MFTVKDQDPQKKAVASRSKGLDGKTHSGSQMREPVGSLQSLQRNLGNGYLQASKPTSTQMTPDVSGLRLQRACACGSTCAKCAAKGNEQRILQPKLTIGSPNDRYEQEADRVADQVMRMPDPTLTKDPQRQRSPLIGYSFRNLEIAPKERLGIQTKLAIEQPGDKYEQEADRVADQVMRMPDPDPLARGQLVNSNLSFTAHQLPVQKQELKEKDEEKKEGKIQAKEEPEQTFTVTPELEGQLQSSQGKGQPLADETRIFMESRFRQNFGQVRVHTNNNAAQMNRCVNSQAFTHRQDVFFGAGRYSPESSDGKRLLAHELTHVIQQRSGLKQVVQRNGEESIEVELISSRDDYQPPGSRETYRVGDAAATRVLMDIQERGSQVVFRVFNFETGAAEEISPAQWSFLRGAAIIGGSNAGITRLGRQLSPSQWRSLWPNPMPEILRRFEAGQITLDDEALLSGYHGMIRSDAARSLDENEQAIDEILSAPDRVQRIQEFATGLREASLVRDTLVQRRDELSHRLAAQHSFTFFPHAGTGPNMVQQLNIQRERSEVEDTLTFWISAFPLLTRLQTQDISTTSVEAKLREIKANIVSTRRELDRGRLDPMTLDTVRARLTGRLGPRATAVIQAEDRSRARWAIIGAVALTAASIGILFLPGGIFIDAAIGVAIAGHANANAIELGHAANTGLHVDDGLVSQSQAQGARFAAVLATVFAVMGAAAAGFRVLRVGLALRALGRSMPELALAERAAVARALASDPTLLSAFTRMAPGDTAISARVAAAVRHTAGDTRALRAALQEIERIAAIPRRVPTGPDLYEPLRRIADGSDIERIAGQTGFSRAEVEAAKRNLMFDEHILVDDVTGALYRWRFAPFEDIANLWGRAARGEALTEADRQFLRSLIRHEQAEGAILSASGRTLEQAFLRGELERRLRTFLQSKGWNQAKIEQMLAAEPRPVTPYRYAHIVSHLSGAPNPPQF